VTPALTILDHFALAAATALLGGVLLVVVRGRLRRGRTAATVVGTLLLVVGLFFVAWAGYAMSVGWD
jgi:hypothetical protein